MSSIFVNALTSTGYVRTPMLTIKAALDALWLSAHGADVDLDPRSSEGQVIGGLSEMYSDLEGHAATFFSALVNPNGATGTHLKNIAALNGIVANAGMPSYVPITITGTPSTVVPTDIILQSTLSDGSTATWSDLYTDEGGGVHTPGGVVGGGGTVAMWAICTENGATSCPSATPMAILTVTSGLTSVAVSSDASLGYVQESDGSLRVRRSNSFSLAAQGPADALDSALNNMPTVVAQAAVWENDTGTVQTFSGGGSINAHSIRVIVAMVPAADQDEVAQKIYELKSSGCSTQGAVTNGNAVDEQGNLHTVRFDLAAALDIKVSVVGTRRSGFPADGAQQIIDAIVAWGQERSNTPLGGDSSGKISWTAVLASFISTPGLDLTSLQLGIVGGDFEASGVSVNIDFDEYAQILSENVTVTIP